MTKKAKLKYMLQKWYSKIFKSKNGRVLFIIIQYKKRHNKCLSVEHSVVINAGIYIYIYI